VRGKTLTIGLAALGTILVLATGCSGQSDTAAVPEAEASAEAGIVGAWVHASSGPQDLNLNWNVQADGTIEVTSPDDPQSQTHPLIYGWRESPGGGYEIHSVPDNGEPSRPFRLEGDSLVFSTSAGDLSFLRAG